MAKNGKAAVNPAERMIKSKTSLIKRLNEEIKHVRAEAEDEVERIQFRIRQAETLKIALEKGTLKA